MPEKNLGILRSRGSLPHVKRRAQTSGALVDASLFRLASEFRRKSRGFIRPATSSLSENLSTAWVARATKAARVIPVRWQGSLACSIGFEGLTTRGSSLFHLFRIHNISFREQAHMVAHLVSLLNRDGYRVGILIFSLDLTGRERLSHLFGDCGLFLLKRFFAIINLRP